MQMCTYPVYKNFAARRYVALTASVKVRIGSPKTVRNEQVCAHQEVNFPKSFFSSCIPDGLQLCTYVTVFLFGVRWRHNRAPNLEPRFLVIFRTLRKDSVANYAWIWTQFSPTVTGSDVLYNALNVS